MSRIEDFTVHAHQMLTRVGVPGQTGPRYESFLMLAFFGDRGDGISRRLIMHFLPAGAEIGSPVVTEVDSALVDGTIFMPIEFLPVVLDMVRNEKPLRAFLCKDDPSFNGISTGIVHVMSGHESTGVSPIMPDHPIPLVKP